MGPKLAILAIFALLCKVHKCTAFVHCGALRVLALRDLAKSVRLGAKNGQKGGEWKDIAFGAHLVLILGLYQLCALA